MDYKDYVGYKGADPDKIRVTFRASNGVQLTEALFEETIQTGSKQSFSPLYTLREYEVNGKPSAYQIYMNSIDESDAALKLVGSLGHWRKLSKLKWFISGRPEVGFEGLSQWRLDMMNRDKTFAKNVLMSQAAEGNVSAARALDKMSQDEYKGLLAATPKVGKSGGKSNEDHDDGLSFLNRG